MFDFDIDDNDLKDITLNGKTFKHIVNSDLKQMINSHLFQTHNIKMNCTNKYFTAIDPENDLNTLKKYKHLAYVNTNQRICLIGLFTFKYRNVCLLIDKQNLLYYILNCQFSSSLYKGTIFEGELLDTHFGTSDFLVYMNKNISSYALDKRLTLLQSIMLPKNYHHDPLLDPFVITVKDFVEYPQLVSFINEYVPTLPYKNKITGLIFRPNENSNKNIIYNFNNKYIFKSATPNEIMKVDLPTECDQIKINTDKYKEAIFLLFETGNPDDYLLKLLRKDGQLFDYDYALVNDMKTSQYLQKVLDEKPETEKRMGICVMCRYMPNFKKWKPIQITDAKLPDNITKLV